MIKTTLPAKRAVSEIVRAYRVLQGSPSRPLSLRLFAASLSEILSPRGGGISHQSVKNWEDRTYLPNPFYLVQIIHQAPMDWRQDFAQDILAARFPDLYQPATQIGIQAIKNGEKETIHFTRGQHANSQHVQL